MTRIGLKREVFFPMVCCPVDGGSMKCTNAPVLVHARRGQALTSGTTVPVFFGWLEMFKGFEEDVHLTRHGFEIDGQGVVLLDDVGVVDLDKGVAQVLGRSELQ